MGLVDGAGQYREAKPRAPRLRPHRDYDHATVTPPPRRAACPRRGWRARVIQVGVIGVEHPFNFAVTQHGEIGIAIDNLGPKHLTVKRQ